MKRAVELAAENVQNGGKPFGAVLVKEGKIVAEAVNEYHLKYDVSGHAELLAIRQTQEQLQTADLAGCTLYASGEPCPMCLSAIYFVGIDVAYYCASVEDAVAAGLGAADKIYKELKNPKENRTLSLLQMPLKAGETDPMKLWINQK